MTLTCAFRKDSLYWEQFVYSFNWSLICYSRQFLIKIVDTYFSCLSPKSCTRTVIFQSKPNKSDECRIDFFIEQIIIFVNLVIIYLRLCETFFFIDSEWIQYLSKGSTRIRVQSINYRIIETTYTRDETM